MEHEDEIRDENALRLLLREILANLTVEELRFLCDMFRLNRGGSRPSMRMTRRRCRPSPSNTTPALFHLGIPLMSTFATTALVVR